MRIDILNRATAISFDEAVREGKFGQVDGRRVPIVGLAALLKYKTAAGREQDLADVVALRARKFAPG